MDGSAKAGSIIERKKQVRCNNRKFMRIWNAQCSMCYDCGDRDQPNNMTLHHIPPLSKRGNDSSGSNVVLCRKCHDKRHAPANAEGEVRRNAVTSTGLLADESKGETK